MINFFEKSFNKTFGKFFSCILSEKNSKSIYIPPGFAHGFCCLEKENYIIFGHNHQHGEHVQIMWAALNWLQ